MFWPIPTDGTEEGYTEEREALTTKEVDHEFWHNTYTPHDPLGLVGWRSLIDLQPSFVRLLIVCVADNEHLNLCSDYSNSPDCYVPIGYQRLRGWDWLSEVQEDSAHGLSLHCWISHGNPMHYKGELLKIIRFLVIGLIRVLLWITKKFFIFSKTDITTSFIDPRFGDTSLYMVWNFSWNSQ